jgi:purine-binding chemotaxis protein CheW
MERGVVFRLEDRLFALPLEVTARAVRAVEITPLAIGLPGVPGVIDVHGEIMPVVDLRERFGLPPRALRPSAQFLLISSARGPVALWVDAVDGVATWTEDDFVAAEPLFPGSRQLRGIARGADGLVLVHDLDALLAPVDEAFAREAPGHD